jgi:hypothetical protein
LGTSTARDGARPSGYRHGRESAKQRASRTGKKLRQAEGFAKQRAEGKISERR